MTGIDTVTGRRNVMKRLGLLGAALPLAGLVGCTDDKAPTSAKATAAAAAAAAPEQAKPVSLSYLPNPAVAPPIRRGGRSGSSR